MSFKEEIQMKELLFEVIHYGERIADKEHKTTEGHYIRFATYKYNDIYYVVTMFNGIVFGVMEKPDIKDLI